MASLTRQRSKFTGHNVLPFRSRATTGDRPGCASRRISKPTSEDVWLNDDVDPLEHLGATLWVVKHSEPRYNYDRPCAHYVEVSEYYFTSKHQADGLRRRLVILKGVDPAMVKVTRL